MRTQGLQNSREQVRSPLIPGKSTFRMTTNLLPNSATPAPYSRSLLDHDGLMTPVLTAQFGPLIVRKTQSHPSTDSVLRRSSIYQSASDSKILDAVLEISPQALPAGVIDQLLNEDILFGQILADFAIPVRITDRTLYQSTAPDEIARWGRRLRIYHGKTAAFICHVDELLVSEAQLLTMRLPI